MVDILQPVISWFGVRCLPGPWPVYSDYPQQPTNHSYKYVLMSTLGTLHASLECGMAGWLRRLASTQLFPRSPPLGCPVTRGPAPAGVDPHLSIVHPNCIHVTYCVICLHSPPLSGPSGWWGFQSCVERVACQSADLCSNSKAQSSSHCRGHWLWRFMRATLCLPHHAHFVQHRLSAILALVSPPPPLLPGWKYGGNVDRVQAGVSHSVADGATEGVRLVGCQCCCCLAVRGCAGYKPHTRLYYQYVTS
jgi:hypothetical protein